MYYSYSMNTKDKGDISELKVATRLMEFGVRVSKPIGDNYRYDLIADDGKLHRIQVKTGVLQDNGSVRFNCMSVYGKGEDIESKGYSNDEIDGFAVYSPSTDDVYYIDIDDAPSTAMHIRVDDSITSPNSNHAKDYKLRDRFNK